MARRRATLIWNPAAGLLRRRAVDERLRRLCADWLEITRVRKTRGPGDAERFAAEVDPQETDLLLVAGGDGTLNAAVNGLRVDVPLGIVPLGTANVLARELGLPVHSLRAMARALAEAEPRRIDVGRCGKRRFVEMVGAGFDAAVVREVGPPEKDLLGPTAYALRALGFLTTPRPAHWEITVDGAGVEAEGLMALVSNTARYGGPLQLAPGASLEDGCLDVTVFTAVNGGQLLRQALAVLSRRGLIEAGLILRRGREISLTAAPRQPLQLDGEPAGFTPVRIQLEPRSLTVLCPSTGQRDP